MDGDITGQPVIHLADWLVVVDKVPCMKKDMTVSI